MSNLIKRDREMTCVADIMKALLDGCVIEIRIGAFIELIDGKLTVNGKITSARNYIKLSEETLEFLTAYKRQEK